MKQIIAKKKSGKPLSKEEIYHWVRGIAEKTVPEYQSAALLMAIYFKGMSVEERSHLTQAMAKSGATMNYRDLGSFIIDKHSTGGIGDKTSLILAPMMVACGLKVPMVSGRGLGFTGGTLDKLESIEGYQTSLDFQEMTKALKEVGCFISGQTAEVAPADEVLYSLRDVTETVDEISLITASILSKKFTEDLDGLILDVKCGSGAFMKSREEAYALAESLVSTCAKAKIACTAIITRMQYPLGVYMGNLCETYEAIKYMQPNSKYYDIFKHKVGLDEKTQTLTFAPIENVEDDLVYVTTSLAFHMLKLSKKFANGQECLRAIDRTWAENKISQVFSNMVEHQGGDLDKFHQQAAHLEKVFSENGKLYIYRAPIAGKISQFDGEALGNLMVKLGAGREVKSDHINHRVSLQFLAVQNQVFSKGDAILKIYHSDLAQLAAIDIDSILDSAIVFTQDENIIAESDLICNILE